MEGHEGPAYGQPPSFAAWQQPTIPVYILRGNHDAQSEVRKALSWPDNVHEFFRSTIRKHSS